MYFETEDYPKSDSLAFIRIFSIDIFQHKFTKFCLLCSLKVCVIISLIQTCIFLKKFDGYYFVKYGPMYFALLFGTATLGGNILLSDAPQKSLKRLELWKIKTSNNGLYQHTKKVSKIITISFIINITLGVCGGILLMLPSEDVYDIFFIYNLIDDFMIPEWKNKISLCFSLIAAFVSCVATASFYQFIYWAAHAKIQMEIILNFTKYINDIEANQNNDQFLNNEEYQHDIKEKLKLIVKRQGKLKEFIRRFATKIRLFTLLYLASGGIFMISITFFLFTFEGSFMSTYVRIIPMLATGLLVYVVVIMGGQQIEDVSSMVFDCLCSLNWYNWNRENEQIYIIMLANSIEPFKVGLSPNISVNYELGVWVVKKIYSIVSVLIQMKNVNF